MMPEIPILRRIAKLGNTTIDKLLSSKIDELNNAGLPTIKLNAFVSHLNNDYIKLSIYHITGAGNEMALIEYEKVGEIIIPKYLYQEFYIPMRVIGDSMEKLIMDNSIIMVDTSPQDQLIDKKIYCFRIPYAGFIIRQANTEPNGLFLQPFNQQYESTKIKWDEFEPEMVVGRVVYSLINNIG